MILKALDLLLDEEPHAGPWNMALDEVLLAQAARPILRAYRWARPSVSFGYFGKIREVEALWPGRETVRRWTGGGIVPHGADFTYSVIIPRSDDFARAGPGESYRLIHAAVARALSTELGGLGFSAKGAPKISSQCFENPAEHDVLAGGKKIAGAAQRRTRDGMLHQGSIQVAGLGFDFAERLARVLAATVARREELPKREAEELAQRRYASEAWLRRV